MKNFWTGKLWILATFSFFSGGMAEASAPVAIPTASMGRLVIFADIKAGELKNDLSLKKGTDKKLDLLSQVGLKPGVHACFRGPVETIKPIIGDLISNTNRANVNEDLKLKSFTADGQQKESIQIEIISDASKTKVVNVTMGPC